MDEPNKEVIEVSNVTKQDIDNRSAVFNLAFMIILILAIGALVYASTTVIKNKDMLSNPLGYNMERFGLTSCSCYDSENRVVDILATNYNGTNPNINNTFLRV